MKTHKLLKTTGNVVIDLVLDTVKKNKQAFIFVNTKKSAEKVAEDTSKNLHSTRVCELIAKKVLNVLGSPTKQCKRLAECVKHGVAFHHSGLHSKQREIIEEEFRMGNIRFISSTPTLAAGISMPAFRVIIRDVKRYGMRGLDYIPVLDFLQMAGRAGRPEFDEYGEAIVIAKSEEDKELLIENYLMGEPEEIYSKLSVEPVLRTYILSLISSGVVNNYEQIKEFFSKTFWAHQYKDMKELEGKINKMLDLLLEWGFVKEVNKKFSVTYLGRRIVELYIDPLTAHEFLKAIKNVQKPTFIGLLHLICNTLEMRPLLSIKPKEYITLQEKTVEYEFLAEEPSEFEPEYESWLKSFKTALMLNDWCEEVSEDVLLKKYNVRPGETRVKINTADWLLYALHELARIQKKQNLLSQISKVRIRLKYGVKEELLSLLKFKGIGRVKARKLFVNKIKNVKDVRSVNFEKLKFLIGEKLALSLKEQVGEKIVNNQRRISNIV